MKRISVRGIIVTDKGLSTIFRRKNGKEYYVIPGGGVEEGESLEEALHRELEEELNIKVNINKLAYKIESEDRIEYFYECDYISGSFTLNGEELERMSEDNYYEPTFIKIDKLDNYNLSKDIIAYFKNRK